MTLTAISEFGAQLLWQPVIGSWLDDARSAAVLFSLLFLIHKMLEGRRVPREHEAVEIV